MLLLMETQDSQSIKAHPTAAAPASPCEPSPGACCWAADGTGDKTVSGTQGGPGCEASADMGLSGRPGSPCCSVALEMSLVHRETIWRKERTSMSEGFFLLSTSTQAEEEIPSAMGTRFILRKQTRVSNFSVIPSTFRLTGKASFQ